jgi:phage terminase small subunit
VVFERFWSEGVLVKKASKNGVRSPAGKKDPIVNGLTPKERLFVDFYLGESRFNATDAARRAGYKGNDNTLSSVGYDNLRKPEIATLVDTRINEAAMSANEVLARLSDIASGKIADLMDEEGRFDLKLAKQRKKDQLLKKLKIKRFSKQVDSHAEGGEEKEIIETSLITEEVEFEMYSAHEALRDLGKYHKLFTDKTEHTGKDGGPIRITRAEDLTDDELAAIAGR